MNLPVVPLASLSDAALIDRLKRLVAIERRATALTLAHLIEFDNRRLHADLGLPSLFAYCVRELGYSEGAAYKRIQAARAARDYPAILDVLAGGQTSLAAVVILAPHLTQENHAMILGMASGQSSRGVESLVARLAPRPDAKDCLRRLSAARPQTSAVEDAQSEESKALSLLGVPLPASPDTATAAQEETSAAARAGAAAKTPGPYPRLEPLSGDRFLFRYTGSTEFRDKYERARVLLRVRTPGNVMAAVFEAALEALLGRIDPQQRHERRLAAQARRDQADTTSVRVPGRPSTDKRLARSRAIPRPIRDAVWHRDGGLCTFIGPDGRRCPQTAGLELDHIVPWAAGGSSSDLRNLRLTCRQHNQLFARRYFGAATIENAIRRRREQAKQSRASPRVRDRAIQQSARTVAGPSPRDEP